jgi:mannosyltransferase OCH1-like enzyme
MNNISNISNISNIEIISDNKDTTVFNYHIKYIDDYNFEIIITFISGSILNLKILNKYRKNEVDISFTDIENSKILNKHKKNEIDISFTDIENSKIINSPFKLVLDNSEYIGKIPKIIHQSYTNDLVPRLQNATHTWQLMNNTYKYMYWTDELSDKYIYENFDERIQEAYFSLYARAYKSDILRLCILYEFGGLWCDISSECIYSFDKIISDEINIVLVKDNPSQVSNGNIYQAFIAVEAKNKIIKYVLDITVDRILNFSKYDIDYPWIHNETIAITGPTIFAIGLNKYLNRNPKNFFSEGFIKFNSNNILLLDHNIENGVGYIFKNNSKFIRTKYENFQKDRTTPHYSKLFSSGFIIKKKIPQTNINNISINSNNLFQIWINKENYGSNYVSDKMYHCYNTWIEKNPELNYIFLDNNSIIQLLEKEDEFPLLLNAYKKIKVFAFKADLVRYYLMYKFSGMYVDIDSYCVNNVKELTQGFDLVLSYDCDKSSISQAFIYSGKPRLEIFKKLIEHCVTNILNENIYDGDTGITGPKLFGKVAQNLFDYINKGSEFVIDSLKIKMINYYLNLPLPGGSWINSSIDYKVDGYILTTLCNSSSGYKKNKVKFLPKDILYNVNGVIKGNSPAYFSFSEGSGFYIYKNKIFCVSKYLGYNEERYILGGNDFAKMYENNNIFC